MHIWLAPLCVASCLANAQAARTSRATRCRSVLLQRARGGVWRAHCLMARGGAAGITPSSTTYGAVHRRWMGTRFGPP
jgi:hypothetical protein